jgi:hypothetical protein
VNPGMRLSVRSDDWDPSGLTPRPRA